MITDYREYHQTCCLPNNVIQLTKTKTEIAIYEKLAVWLTKTVKVTKKVKTKIKNQKRRNAEVT